MEEAVSNASDEEQVKKAGVSAKHRRREELRDLRMVMETVNGRRFMHRLIEFCGVFKTSFTGNSTTFFNEGQRNVGLKLLNDMNEGATDLYAMMMKEASTNE